MGCQKIRSARVKGTGWAVTVSNRVITFLIENMTEGGQGVGHVETRGRRQREKTR